MTDIESTIIIKECLDCLTPRQREAVEYRAAGLKFFEIAAAMGIKERAVYRLIERAKSNIQELNIDVQ